MSETETLQEGQTDTVTGVGSVTTDDGMQQVVTGDATTPVVDPTVAVDPTLPAVDPTATPVDPATPVAPVVEVPSVTPGVQPDKTVVMYNGQAVVKRFGLFDADQAEECELADGTTVFVPKSVLGA